MTLETLFQRQKSASQTYFDCIKEQESQGRSGNDTYNSCYELIQGQAELDQINDKIKALQEALKFNVEQYIREREASCCTPENCVNCYACDSSLVSKSAKHDTLNSISNNTTSKPSYEDLEKELAIARTANAEIQKVNDDLSNRVNAIEQESRTEKIANIVSGAYPQDADEKVNYFVKSGLSVEEISKIVAPLKSSRIKAASYNSQVAIKNESPKNNGWQNSLFDLVGGGSA